MPQSDTQDDDSRGSVGLLGKTPLITRLKIWFALLVIAAGGCAAILGTPVQVDDPLYIAAARQIRATPASPYAGHPNWYAGSWFAENANPPLWPYLLAGVSTLVGEQTFGLQLLQCFLNVVLIVGLHRLTQRFVSWPIFWTAALAWSPFLLPGRNLMADTLFLACCVWAVCWFLQAIHSSDHDGWWGGHPVWSAGASASAAILTKYTGGLLLPLFAWECVRRRRVNLTPAVILPSVLFGIWCLHNVLYYGQTHFGSSLSGGGFDLVLRVRILLKIVGGLFVWTPLLGLALLGFHGGWRWILFGLAAAPVAAWFENADLVAAFQRGQVNSSASLQLQSTLMFVNGLLGVLWTFALLRSSRTFSHAIIENPSIRHFHSHRSFLAWWLAAGVLFNLVAASTVAFGAVRHLTIIFIPWILLTAEPMVAGMGRLLPRTIRGLLLFGVGLFGALLGGALTHADRTAASIGPEMRRAATKFLEQGMTVWFAGDAAIRWHLDGTGAQFWTGADGPKVGDFILIPYSRSGPFRLSPMLVQQSRLVARQVVETPNRLQTQSEYSSFYAANLLTLPWFIQWSPGYNGPGGGLGSDEILIYERRR